MKKICIIFLLSIIISLTALGFGGFSSNGAPMYALNTQNQTLTGKYLRIHIRADSNEDSAQAVKYKVRDGVVEYLTPLVADYTTKAEAMKGVSQNLHGVCAVAEKILHQEGFSYGATAEVTVENFPTRVYGGYTLPAGEYTALIVRLGRGEGDNWWCVVYPPLCFAATNSDVVYKSKIKEIIENFYR
ncbi:MAG: stage II sporulation protein R [Clostridia bacterium]|nr:stage II sporulation protein R [Clostridia bacterium]